MAETDSPRIGVIESHLCVKPRGRGGEQNKEVWRGGEARNGGDGGFLRQRRLWRFRVRVRVRVRAGM